MQIQKSGRMGDLFSEELSKKMPKQAEQQAEAKDTPKDEQLSADRDDKKQEASTELKEVELKSDRKPLEPALYEKLLDEHRKEETHSPNEKASGITERRLNEASKDAYPHRNRKAHERTGEKRPINALPEEMGSASDEGKRKRFEKAQGEGKKRLLDKDVGSQLTSKPFNLREKKAVAAADYVAYRKEGQTQTASARFAEVRDLDEMMSCIMQRAQQHNRQLVDDERAQVAALKERKARLLLRMPQ